MFNQRYFLNEKTVQYFQVKLKWNESYLDKFFQIIFLFESLSRVKGFTVEFIKITSIRSSCFQMFYKVVALKTFVKFTG